MNSHFCILIISMISSVFGKESEPEANKDVNTSDDSIIVNKEGLNDATESDKKYQRNERYPPKNMKKLTLSEVADQAKKEKLGSVAILAVYAKDSALHRLPETVLQVAEKDLENNTKSDQQLVDYGDKLEGYTSDGKDNEDDNDDTNDKQDNKDKDNKENKDDDNDGGESPKTSEGQQLLSSKNES